MNKPWPYVESFHILKQCDYPGCLHHRVTRYYVSPDGRFFCTDCAGKARGIYEDTGRRIP